MRKKWIKRILYVLAALLLLLIILWGVLYWYVQTHKKELLTRLEKAAGERIEGQLHIQDISPELFRTFPNISIRVDGISLQDSLYEQHHQKLIDLKHAYVRLNIFSVIMGKPRISKIIADEGIFHIFIDQSGYSNNYLLKPRAPKTKAKKSNLEVANLEINNVAFIIDNVPMNKRFHMKLREINAKINSVDSFMKIKADVNILMGGLGFKLSKGSFLKNAEINGTLQFDYNTITRLGVIQERDIEIDNEKLKLKAWLRFGGPKVLPFEIDLEGKKITYNVAVKWLSDNIFSKLSRFDFAKTLEVSAVIRGDMLERGTNPYLDINFKTEGNTVSLLGSTFTDVYFKGKFFNHVDADKARHDSNSVVLLDSIHASYNSIPVSGRDVVIMNFVRPYVIANLKEQFDAAALNNTFGSQFTFTRGTCSYDLKYNGYLFANSLIPDEIYGAIDLKNFDFVYNSRNLKFHNGNASLGFNGPDLLLNKVQIFAQNSDISINGVSKDFLKSFVELPGKATMNLHLLSNNIDLGAFMTYFVQKRSAGKKSKVSASDRLDAFLTNSNIAMDMQIRKAVYRKMVATNVVSSMSFANSGLTIHKLHLNHAQGAIDLSGKINQQVVNNPFNLQYDVDNVQVSQLFYAMNSFGFKALTDKNVSGNISLNGTLNGNVTDKGMLLADRLNGTLKYDLNKAALKDFSLFDKVQKWFKNRRLDNIEIERFIGSFDIRNGTIYIPKTELHTSALNLSFAGIYGLAPGKPTNIDFRVPLRNPQVDKERQEKGMNRRKGEGLVINLNAHSDQTGKIVIGVGKSYGKDDGKVVDEDEE